MSERSSWRPATKEETREYYANEFRSYLDALPEWITNDGPKEFAVAFDEYWPSKKGSRKKKFARRSTKKNGNVVMDSLEAWNKFFTSPSENDPIGDLIPPGNLPGKDDTPWSASDPVASKAVYYKLDHHDRFWVLAFDIDAKDVALNRLRGDDDDRPDREVLKQSPIGNEPPVCDTTDHVYNYTYDDIQGALDEAFRLKRILIERLNFTDVRVFYTGQGAHIYALDEGMYHRYTKQARDFLVEYIEGEFDIPLDKKVTPDQARVMRLPMSLHTDVCRVVTEIESPNVDFVNDELFLPEFITTKDTRTQRINHCNSLSSEKTSEHASSEKSMGTAYYSDTQTDGTADKSSEQGGQKPTHKSGTDYFRPVEAWKRIIDPDKYSESERVELIKQGQDYYRTGDGEFKGKQFINAVEEFAIRSFEDPNAKDIMNNPWVPYHQPSRLLTLYTAAAYALQHSPVFDRPHFKIKANEYAQDAFLAHINGALANSKYQLDLAQAIGEAVLRRKQEDNYGPPPGQPVTDIVSDEDEVLCLEMPVVQSSRHALVEADPDINPTDAGREFAPQLINNHLYIPVDYVWSKTKFHVDGSRNRSSIIRLYDETYRKMTRESARKQLVQDVERVNDHLQNAKHANKTHKLFKETRIDETLRCLLKAVYLADPKIANLEDWVTAQEILGAIEWFKEEPPKDGEGGGNEKIKSWEQYQLEDLNTTKKVSYFLRDNEGEHVEILKNKNGIPNEYLLEYTENDVKKVDVKEIKDLLELPCLSNIHEHNKENKPVRFVLFTLVRIIISMENDFSNEDIHELFSEYPWYDSDITDWQIDYERRQDASPISCKNDNTKFVPFCIGIENCDYSIWRSLNFRPDVYDTDH